MLAANLACKRKACDLFRRIVRIVHDHIVAGSRCSEIAVRNFGEEQSTLLRTLLITRKTWPEIALHELIKRVALRVACSPRQAVQTLQIKARPQLRKIHRIDGFRSPEGRLRDF